MKKPQQYPLKKRPIFVIIQVDIYKSTILISVNQTDAQLRKSLSTITPPFKSDVVEPIKFDGHAFAFCTQLEGTKSSLIRLRSLENYAQFIATTFHEIFHAVHNITEGVGIKLSDESEEAYAYLIGYITKEFFSVFK